MVRSNPTPPKKSRRVLYSAIGLAAVLAVSVYVLVVLPSLSSPPAMVFSLGVSIQYVSNGQAQFFSPRGNVGVAGGFWQSHQYDAYGLDGRYPIYAYLPTSGAHYFIVYVRSTVVHQYTLGDFFRVWGQPLGRNDTLGIPAGNGYYWAIWVGAPPAIRQGEWGSQVLADNQNITLIYSSNGGI